MRHILPLPRLLLAVLTGSLTLLAGAAMLGGASALIVFSAAQPAMFLLFLPALGVRVGGLSRAAFRYVERLAAHDAVFRAMNRLRSLMLNRWVHSGSPVETGTARMRFMQDMNRYQDTFLRGRLPLMIQGVVLTSGGIWILNTDRKLGACFFGALAMAAVMAWRAYRLSDSHHEAEERLRSRLSDTLQTTLAAREEISVYGLKQAVLDKLSEAGAARDRARRQTWHMERGRSLAGQLLAAVMTVVSVVILTEKGASASEIMGVTVLLMVLMESVPAMQSAALHLGLGRGADMRISAVQSGAAPDEVQCAAPQDELVFHGLTVRTPEGRRIFSGLKLTLKMKQWVVITGPSGCGKTTLAKVICGLLPYDHGSVHVDGTLQPYFSGMPEGMNLMPQQVDVFFTTFRDNLRTGRPDAEPEALADACRRTGLPEERMASEVMPPPLSGGERRRLAAARALLHGGKFLVMDEPTAGLDAVASEKILRALYASAEGGVLIVHHLPAVLPEDAVLLKWKDLQPEVEK